MESPFSARNMRTRREFGEAGEWYSFRVSGVMAVNLAHGCAENDAASELGAAVNMDGLAGDPARIVAGQEGHHRGDVLWLGHALQRLHGKRDFAAGMSSRSPTMARTRLARRCGPSACRRSAPTFSARPPVLRISATTASASFSLLL